MGKITKLKIGLNEIISVYEKTLSIWSTGKALGITGQRVHSILKRSGYVFNKKGFTEEEKKKIINFYTSEKHLDLDKLTELLGRKSKTSVARVARQLGLTKVGRTHNKQSRDKISKAAKGWIALRGHPKGSLGLKHTKETKNIISKNTKKWWKSLSLNERSDRGLRAYKTRLAKGDKFMRTKTTWKSGWEVIGGKRHYFRSSWEVKYAKWLEHRKAITKDILDWEFEPVTFWFEKIKRGTRSYMTDFRITKLDGSQYYDEVKGWMDDKSKTKLKRMKKYYPDITINIIDKHWFKANADLLEKIIEK